jgi:GNAT superfamily N-acetyltransferase
VSHDTPSLAEFYRAQGEGWRAFLGAAERGETWAAPGVSVGIAGEASADLNLVFAYGPEGVAEGIASAAAELRRRGVPGTVFAASTVAGAAAAAGRALGLARGGRAPLMCAHATDIVREGEGHETRVVDDTETMLAAGDVLADAFDLPVDWCRRVLGVGFARLPGAVACLVLHNGRPVAVAGSGLAGDIAGVFAVGTRASHRRRGAGAAAVTAVVDHQIRAGARWFGLFPASPAEPFYAGLGFVPVDHPSVWLVRSE